jgi:O-acetyl-ADP-ribose deacetylase (regulator of RNase III)
MAQARLFISYKTGIQNSETFKANAIRNQLSNNGYTVWMMDEREINAGQPWNAQIYERISQSDVLLLVLADKTAESDWVRREVDVARGASIGIIPIITPGEFDIDKTLDQFDLKKIECVTYVTGGDIEYEHLIRSIDALKKLTRKKQRERLEEIQKEEEEALKPKARTLFDPNDLHYAKMDYLTYHLADCPQTKVHLAVGDMMWMKGIDVYVNSENEYMQMGRIFERKTISALLRYYGSQTDPTGHQTIQDTLQDELNTQVSKKFGTRPVGLTTVIETSAGHPKSKLCTTIMARYVFHAATTLVVGYDVEKELQPIKSSQVRECVRKILDKIGEVNDVMGIISPENTAQREKQEEAAKHYEPIKSIILPLLGSGHAGSLPEEVVWPMVKGVKEFLLEKQGLPMTLEHIYLSALFKEDAQYLQNALEQEFTRVT